MVLSFDAWQTIPTAADCKKQVGKKNKGSSTPASQVAGQGTYHQHIR
jgi:hypothetical protein